jgi:hypothetical protein
MNHHPADESVEKAWAEEIERRVEEIESGKIQMVAYEEVRRRMAARLAEVESLKRSASIASRRPKTNDRRPS